MPIDKNGNEIPQSTHNLVGYRESLQLFYSPNHELIKSITIKDEGLKVVKTVTHYYYDAFGRRIGKSSSTQKSSKLNQRGELVRFPSNLSSLNTTDRPQRNNTLMLWDGNRQIQEITDDFTFTTVYEQNSFVPVARIVERQPHLLEQAKRDEQAEWAKYENMQLTKRSKANIHHKAHTGLRIYHYHTDHLGTPQELTNDRGEVVWLNYQMAWGGSFSQLNHVYNLDGLDISADELQPFRFQGQFFDGETGLHYNRFRYYDSDVGMFISRDPIELMGGFNVFAYAPNPIHWIDPWGLANESVYRLLDSNGNTIYYGITDRSPPARGNEHINDGKVFSKMEVLAEGLSHDEARTIEGVLIRNRINPADLGKPVEVQLKNSGLINKNRGRVETRWISDNPLEDLKHRFLEKPKNVELKKLNPCSK